MHTNVSNVTGGGPARHRNDQGGILVYLNTPSDRLSTSVPARRVATTTPPGKWRKECIRNWNPTQHSFRGVVFLLLADFPDVFPTVCLSVRKKAVSRDGWMSRKHDPDSGYLRLIDNKRKIFFKTPRAGIRIIWRQLRWGHVSGTS